MSNSCNVPCPYCGKDVDVVMGMELLAGTEWTGLLTGLPNSTIGALLRYLELFKPKKQELRWARRLSITQEIIPMMKEAKVNRRGIIYPAPMLMWEAEMLRLVTNRPETLVLPLKSNGYLISIIAGKGEQQAALQEQKIEQQRQNRGSSGTSGFKPVSQVAKPKQPPPDGWKGSLNKNPSNNVKTGDEND